METAAADKGKENEDAIYFYESPTTRSQASHIFLSVHYYCTFKDDEGKEYHSCTDYYHTNKMLILGDPKAAEEVHKLQSGQEAFDLARKLQAPYEKTPKWEEWEKRKVDVMKAGIKLKFEQNKELIQGLVMTDDKILVEDHPTDTFWYNRVMKR